MPSLSLPTPIRTSKKVIRADNVVYKVDNKKGIIVLTLLAPKDVFRSYIRFYWKSDVKPSHSIHPEFFS